MTRQPVWQTIAETLRHEITEGLYPEGTKLPTEAQLSARFGVNRHTVRHALAALAEAGLTVSRRGAGVFVASAPRADYPLGRRVRFHQNVSASGRTPTREVLRIESRPAREAEAEALALPAGANVHVFEGISLGDALPLAVFRSVFPAARFPDLPAALARLHSVTQALAAQGLRDYTRATTRVTAKVAKGPRAGLLKLPEGAPILRTEAVNIDADGVPVEFGISWFAGDRVALTVSAEPGEPR
ncbi:phosphonate metabolism transcriptional regulator PhnF [Sedimentimonas flavescens]|uniref:phosphonate metabolism transcriptional regulator PhnF n=1 Tax=Sedimentimonas flavescens TaxID=2851012 RepID=UPI001C4A2DC4|nr:phosphonate metabolism transcriptional regulator PhnF [Sedimentimonas flavescens]MBW0158189.1 phosphonate metabolism transcriptional regulator PhnF [Sedimentimonas flavescens]